MTEDPGGASVPDTSGPGPDAAAPDPTSADPVAADPGAADPAIADHVPRPASNFRAEGQPTPVEAPAHPVAVAMRPAAPPGAVEIVARGLDVNVQLSGHMRRLSIFVGLLFLAAIGPIALVAIAHSAATGSFDWIGELIDGSSSLADEPVRYATLILGLGAISAAAVSVDVQLMAIGTVGGRLTGRSIDLRSAIRLARAGFWRLVFASIAVGLILYVPRQIVVDPALRGAGEIRLLLTTLFDLVISTPFAYVGAAVVLGGVGPVGAIRDSWRMVRRRWRLAFVIGLVNTAVSYLSTFAIGAGLDILVRIGDALGIDRGLAAAQVLELAVIVGFAIVAVGSLTMTIAALSVAPQVVAWLGLGGSIPGLGPPVVHPLDDPPRRARLVSWPMTVALVAEIILAMAATVDEVSRGGFGA